MTREVASDDPSRREMGATVVVATRNRPADVALAVSSVLADPDPGLEIVVVDQSDDDSTELALSSHRCDGRLRYIHSDTPGKSIAMNTGLRLAKAEYVLFTDDDCEVPAGWVQALTGIFDEQPQVGAVFCQVVAGPHDSSKGFVPTFLVPEDRLWTSSWRLANPEMGAGMAVRRSVVDALGGFDEQMGPGGRFPSADDTDIAARLLAAGWHVMNTNSTEVVHHGFRSFDHGAELTRRDWSALGATFGKAARCRSWGTVVNGLYLAVNLGLIDPLVSAARRRSRPTGLGRLYHFCSGFRLAYVSEIDRHRALFK